MTDHNRSFDLTLPLPAAPDEVWRALTEAGELVRWFPLEAAVEPGVGGRTEWGWRELFRWPNTIETWEPGRKLTLVQESGRPYDADGRPLPEGSVESARLAIEFTIEKDGDASRLRVVHSGFGRGAAWDDELDSISHGWAFELRSLAHYLAHHRGRERASAFLIRSTALDRAALWRRLRATGWSLPPSGTAPGRPVTLELPTGDRFSGTLIVSKPDRQLAATAAELGNGLLRIETWSQSGGTALLIEAASWRDGDANAVAALETRLGEAVDRLLAA